MSDYTTQLRFICEAYAGRGESAPSGSVDEIVELARKKIFDFNYPIFDENYRKELETKILNHFYTQEIGLETVGLWKLKLRTKMREIMPYYNQLYLSERLQFDPFINTNYVDERQTVGTENAVTSNLNSQDDTRVTVGNDSDSRRDTEVESRTGNKSNVSRETSNATGVDEATDSDTSKTEFNPISDRATLTKHSDTPLGSVNGVTAVGDDSNYLSDVSETIENYNGGNKKDVTDVDASKTHVGSSVSENEIDRSSDDITTDNATIQHASGGSADHVQTENGTLSGNSHSESDRSNASDYAGKLFGKTGSETYSEMLMKFRDTFLNIDMQVIAELDGLFMQIW